MTVTVLIFIQKTPYVTSSSKSIITSAENGSKQLLYLLVLLPYPNDPGIKSPSWSGGLNVLPAIRLAVEHVNNDSDILQEYELRWLEQNGGCDIKVEALLSFVECVTYSDLQIVGLIGPGCSASTLVVAPLTVKNEIALINMHGAGTPIMENHKEYPYSFGIFGSSQGAVDTMITLMRDRGWNEVAVFYDPSRVFQSSTFDALTRTIDSINKQSNTPTLKISLSAAVYEDFLPLYSLRKSLKRIVFVMTGPQIARNLLCLAYHEQLLFPDIQWVLIERLLNEFQQDVQFELHGEPYYCSRHVMTQIALNGSLTITYRLAPLNTTAPTHNGRGISYKDFQKSYLQKINDHNSVKENENRSITPSPWGSMYYDAVWAVALALNSADNLNEFDLGKYGMKSTNKPYGDRQLNQTLVLQKELHKLNFSGISGPVHFNNSTGYTDRPFDILQIFNGKDTRVAYYDGGENIVHLSPGGNYTEGQFPTRVKLLPQPLTIVLGVITAVILMATGILHFTAIYFRKHYTVRASSPKLSQLAYIGCYLLMLATLIHTATEGFKLEDVTRIALCHTINILWTCGLTLLFGTICAKTWRLYRIFNHSWKPGKLLSGQFLFVCITSATIVDIVINILWISIDTIRITKTNYAAEEHQRVITVTQRCESDYYIMWFSLLFMYNYMFVFGALALAILTRKIRLSGFHTKSVVMLTYSVSFLVGLGMPIEIIFKTDKTVTFILASMADCLMLLAIVTLSIIFLFVPPLIPVFTYKYKKYKGELHSKNNTTA